MRRILYSKAKKGMVNHMITISEKGTAELTSTPEVKIRPQLASDYNRLKSYLEYLDVKSSCVFLSYIGTTVEGRGIPMVTLGRNRNQCGNVYVGGVDPRDMVSPCVLLRYISDYRDFLETGRRIYGMSIPCLWEKRTTRVIPMLNPDGYSIRRHGPLTENEDILALLQKSNDSGSPDDWSHWRCNGAGVDLNTAFLSPDCRKVPECAALGNLLELDSDSLELVLELNMTEGIRYSAGKTALPRAKTVARLLSRMSGYRLVTPDDGGGEESGLCEYVITRLKKSAYSCGCRDKGAVTLPPDGEDYVKVYAAMREALFSCPML